MGSNQLSLKQNKSQMMGSIKQRNVIADYGTFSVITCIQCSLLSIFFAQIL